MPTLYARSINVRLSVAKLEKTITPSPLNTLCQESVLNADRATKQFQVDAKDGSLPETSLCCDETGCSLGFLGESQNMPFFMVHAKPMYPFDQPLRTHQPHALCLRVLPKEKAFLKTYDPAVGWTYNDIKIDVYLNGDLCASSYVPQQAYHIKSQDTFSGARNGRLKEKPWVLIPPHVDILENPANSSESGQIGEDARSRWTAISNALLFAAQSHGQSSRGEIPLIGQYLQNVAAIPMPAKLPSMLSTDHKRFSIIDVLVTSGRGNKDPVQGSYLVKPSSLKLHGFRLKEELSILGGQESPEKQEPVVVNDQEMSEEQQPIAGESFSRRKKSFADQQIALQTFFPHPVSRSSTRESKSGQIFENQDVSKLSEDRSIHQAARKPPVSQISMPELGQLSFTSETPETEHSLDIKPPVARSKRLPRVRKAPRKSQGSQSQEPRSRAESDSGRGTVTPLQAKHEERRPSQASAILATSRDVPPPRKKRRTQYYDVIDTRQTQAEEIEDIARQAADKEAIFFIERRITRSKLANNTDDQETTENAAPQEVLPKPNVSESNLSLPSKRKKPHAAMDTASQDPTTAQPHPAALFPNLSHRQRNRSSPPISTNSAESSSPEKPLMLGRNRSSTTMPNRNPSLPPTALQPQTHDRNSTSNEPAKKASSKMKLPGNTEKPASAKPAAVWETPPLSRGSIVTYAEDGVERQIRAERGGWFKEEEVLVGVRFVVG